MTPDLSRRLAAVKEMAFRKKNTELGFIEASDWWDDFIGGITKGAGFDDLSQNKQEMILEWEAAIRREVEKQKYNT